MKGPKLLT